MDAANTVMDCKAAILKGKKHYCGSLADLA